MKFLFVFLTVFMLTGCSTVAGTINGIGEDVKTGTDKLTNWIKPGTKEKK